MISHRQILVNVATAVRDSATVRDYCVSHFGRGLAINVGAYPSGVPGEDDSPFLWMMPKEESEQVGTDETFTMQIVVGGCVKGENGENVIENIVTARTATANGLTVNGGNKVVEDLRDAILAVILDARPGAIVAKVRREENDISHFPLEWATAYVDYFEPEGLTDR